MAERKAKEIAIDVAFANYLIEERKKQEAKEREKEQMRREKGVILRNIFYRIHKRFSNASYFIINIFPLVLRYGNDLRKMIEETKIQRTKELKEYLQIENMNDNKTFKIKSFSESMLGQSKKISNN